MAPVWARAMGWAVPDRTGLAETNRRSPPATGCRCRTGPAARPLRAQSPQFLPPGWRTPPKGTPRRGTGTARPGPKRSGAGSRAYLRRTPDPPVPRFRRCIGTGRPTGPGNAPPPAGRRGRRKGGRSARRWDLARGPRRIRRPRRQPPCPGE